MRIFEESPFVSSGRTTSQVARCERGSLASKPSSQAPLGWTAEAAVPT